LKVFLCGPLHILCALCVRKLFQRRGCRGSAETAKELAIQDTTKITLREDCAAETYRSDYSAKSTPSIPKARRLRCPLATYPHRQGILAALHPVTMTTGPRIPHRLIAIHLHREGREGSPGERGELSVKQRWIEPMTALAFFAEIEILPAPRGGIAP
jgi:hypothetical protein